MEFQQCWGPHHVQADPGCQSSRGRGCKGHPGNCFLFNLVHVWLLDYSNLLKARHDELTITLHDHELIQG